MSTDHTAFDLAPSNGAATATRERTEPTTPTKSTSTTKTSKKKPTNPDAPHDTTLGGVLIPGGIITGLIALCWMTHQFGLGPVIFGLLACAAAASAALAVKTRNAIRKATGHKGGGLRSAGGAGPGTRGVLGSAGSARNPSGGLRSTGRTGTGPRSLGSTGRSGGASVPSQARRSGSGFGMTGGGSKPTGPASRKPAGLGSFAKTTPATGGRNNLPKQAGPALGKSAAATGGPAKSLLGGGKSAGGKGLLGGSKASGAGTSSGGKSGSQRGLLGRKGSTSGGSLGAGTSSTGNGKPSSHKKGKNTGTGAGSATGKAGAAASRGRLGAFLRRNPTAQTQPATAKGHNKKKPTHGTPTSPSTPQQIKAAKKAAKAAKNNKGHNGTNPKPSSLKPKKKPTTSTKNNSKSKKPWKSPSTNPHRAPIGPARRGAYWVGKKLRKHTTRKTRLRIKKVVSPVRSTLRTFNRFASPLLAHTVRFASRAILHSHMLLGTIRYTSAGPNWLRPLTRLLHVVTSPVARLVAASGSWRWMNSWIYRNTTPQTSTTSKTTPSQKAPLTAGQRRPITSPAAPTAGTSTKGSTVSSVQHTMPLIYAAEAVRAAGVMLLLNPAENMVGYEATMRQLADVQHAIGQVVQAAGLSTQENFKVNPAVSDAYFDTAGYAHTVGERLDAIPDLFRIIHAEQIENIENPTPQGAKWDQAANNLGE